MNGRNHKASYSASYQLVGVTSALCMGFAAQKMGARPEVYSQSIWGRYDAHEVAIDIYLAFFGTTFFLAFGTMVGSAGVNAVIHQTPPMVFTDFISKYSIDRIEFIHVLQGITLIMFCISAWMQVSMAAHFAVGWTMLLVAVCISYWGVRHFVLSVVARNCAMKEFDLHDLDNPKNKNDSENESCTYDDDDAEDVPLTGSIRLRPIIN